MRNLQIYISPKKVTRVLILTVVLLTLGSFVGRLLQPILGEVVKMVNVSADSGIPAWYSALALLFSSILLAVIAFAKRQFGGPYVLQWAGLSVIFLYLSADEMLRLHERASSQLVKPALAAMGIDPSEISHGFFYYTWIFLYIPLLLVFVLAYMRFLVNLPRFLVNLPRFLVNLPRFLVNLPRFLVNLPAQTRLMFLAAGLLFVGGAVGVEMINARFDYLSGTETIQYSLFTHLEELLEMLGIVVFIHALLSYISSLLRIQEVQLRLKKG